MLVQDELRNGRGQKMLRAALAVEVAALAIAALNVLEVLIVRHRNSEHIQNDKGSKHTSYVFQSCPQRIGATQLWICPGSHWDNGLS